MAPVCSNCKWFFTDKYTEHGFCRRLPPVAAQDGDFALFPMVRNEWLCGEYAMMSWHPSHIEPDRNAPGYGAILSFVKASQAKNTATRASTKAKNGKAKTTES
jgi:hypothetical protein